MPVGLDDAAALVRSCAAPSEAFWRMLELEAVRECAGWFREPVLEVGCGDGTFTRLTGIPVRVGTDVEPRAVERAQRDGPYEEVLRMDLRTLDLPGRFGTIFANSVLEHVEGLEDALPGLRVRLAPGGRLIATVPLPQMNDHLAFRGDRYAAWRQRQLRHRNLWSRDAWEERLRGAGFGTVQWHDYLPGEACRAWDRADVLGALGTGRYRLAQAAHHGVTRLAPRGVRTAARRRLAEILLSRAGALTAGPPCAAVLCAAA